MQIQANASVLVRKQETPPNPRNDQPLAESAGPLLTAQQVAGDIFGGSRSPQWVRRHVPYRIALGHSTVRWFEADVRAWIDDHREER